MVDHIVWLPLPCPKLDLKLTLHSLPVVWLDVLPIKLHRLESQRCQHACQVGGTPPPTPPGGLEKRPYQQDPFGNDIQQRPDKRHQIAAPNGGPEAMRLDASLKLRGESKPNRNERDLEDTGHGGVQELGGTRRRGRG